MLINEGDALKRAIVCSPIAEYFRVENLAVHNIGEIAVPETSIGQHKAMCDVLRSFGCEVIDIPELPGHPNSVFTRDMAVVMKDGYIRLSMGIATRMGEESHIAATLDTLGEPCFGRITLPGTVEGGDVIICGSTAFIGHTQRTNIEGIRQFSSLMSRAGYGVRVAELPDRFLHLDQAIGVLASGRLMVCGDLFPRDLFMGFEIIELPCRTSNVNFICLGPNEIILPRTNEQGLETAMQQKIRVHALELSEFSKGMGGPNCLIMPLERSGQA
jgi:dimethylargininase